MCPLFDILKLGLCLFKKILIFLKLCLQEVIKAWLLYLSKNQGNTLGMFLIGNRIKVKLKKVFYTEYCLIKFNS